MTPAAHQARCALYLRLSHEDDCISGDSDISRINANSASIETQRKILHKFATENNLCIYREYVDDGYSGTIFDRPAFSRLLRDIESGQIDILLTKDLSRLGRNSGRISLLLDEFLPQHHVRYISVTEGFDTAQRSAANNLLAPMHNLVNELYAADISLKIRSALDIKIQQGEYIGAFAPFGYRKNPANKNQLIIDEKAATIVRKIFSLARNGMSPAQIASLLNQENIPTPLQYRQGADLSATAKSSGWQGASVSRLLRNQVYLGHTVQGKTFKPSFKSKYTYTKPREEWVCVPDTHPAIIDEDTWNIVRKTIYNRRQIRSHGFCNLFSGIAKCADCGKNMSTVGTRRKNATANLNCGGYKVGGKKICTSHTIDYDVLYNAVLGALERQINLTEDDRKCLMNFLLRQGETMLAPQNRFSELHQRLETLNCKLTQLFDDKYSGLIADEQFSALHQRFNNEKQQITAQIAALPPADASSPDHEFYQECLNLLSKYEHLQQLSQPLLFTLIERIDIHQGEYRTGVKHQQIDIYCKFDCQPEKYEQTISPHTS